jgi:O-antigen/teichoic acid export membrane protein
MLGPKEFGVWGLFMVISSIVESARIALIKNAFMRFTHQTDEKEQGRLQSAALILSLAISLSLSLLSLLLSRQVAGWLKAPLLSEILQLYSVTLLMSSLFSHFEMLLNARMNFKGICWMYCVRQGILALFIIVYFVFKLPIDSFLLSIFYLFSVVVGTVTGFAYARPYLKWDFKNYTGWLGRLASFGKYVFGNSISSLLFRSTDNFITSTYFGTAVSAYYNSCWRISNLVDLPSQVFADTLFPKAAKYNSSDRGAIKNMYEKTVGAIMIFSIPALIVIVSVPTLILHILAGNQFIVAAPILRITAFFGFSLPFLKQFGIIMDATGHPDISFRIMFLALCLNIVANLAGVHFFGIIGAALGTAFTYTVIFVITQVILYKRFNIRLINVFKNTVGFYGEIIASRGAFLAHTKN